MGGRCRRSLADAGGVAVSGGTAMAERLAAGEAQAFRSSGKLHRSRGVARARGLHHRPALGRGIPLSRGRAPAKSEGTARRAAHPVRLFTPSREGVAPLGAPSRRFQSLAPCFPAATRAGIWRPPIRAASAALRLRHVQPLKAGPRSGAGRLAGASRAQVCETCPRAPALSPRPAQPVRVPSRTGRGGL